MKSQKGFTIIELLIATVVFGTLLTIAISGFTAIGNIFYKGIALTQTQSAATQTIKDISSNIQTSSNVSDLGTVAGKYTYYCVGGVRYTFWAQHKLDTGLNENYAPTGVNRNYGLLRDTLPSGNGCTAPCNVSAGCTTSAFNNPQEILGNNMRIMDLKIVASADHVYTINVVLAYGEDDSFDNVGDPNTIACKGDIAAQRFCAVNRLSTSVYQGLHT